MENWLIASYKTNEVKKVEENLSNQRFDYYLPRVNIKKLNSNSKVELLFPGYIFVRTNIENYSALKYTRGIKHIIKFGENIPFINDDEVNYIKKVEETSESRPVIQSIQIGQDVTIAKGSLKGNIVKIFSLPSKERVEILLSILGTTRRVSVLKRDIII